MFVVRDGARLYCRVEGTGEPPLVFVHGPGVDHRIWDEHVDHFAARHRVVATDLRGFGQSDPAEAYTMEVFRDDLASVIDQLHLAPAVVIGQASGAEIANWVAVDRPGRVKALIFADYVAARRSQAAPWAPTEEHYRQRAAAMAADWRGVGVRILVDNAFPEPVPQALKRRIEGIARTTSPEIMVQMLTRSIEEGEREQYLERISVPTLILQSTIGLHLGREQGRFIHERVSGSRLHYFEDRGHWFFMSGPQDFWLQVEQFLSTLGDAHRG